MGVLATIKRWIPGAQTGWESAFDENERAALARDIGMSESTFVEITRRGSKPLGELPSLMRAVGLDNEEVEREHLDDLRDMQIVCSVCDARSRCRSNLRNGTARSSYGLYCPNAHILRRLIQGAPAIGPATQG